MKASLIIYICSLNFAADFSKEACLSNNPVSHIPWHLTYVLNSFILSSMVCLTGGQQHGWMSVGTGVVWPHTLSTQVQLQWFPIFYIYIFTNFTYVKCTVLVPCTNMYCRITHHHSLISENPNSTFNALCI